MKEFYHLQPEYLGHGACDPACVVQGEHYRFSVLTPHLLRLEYSEDGVFEDRPSQVVLCRVFAVPEFTVREQEDRLEISTCAFHLVYNKKEFTPENLYIDAKNRYTNYGARWRYGAKGYGNPFRHHNLLGTTRTLDKIDGPTPLEHGLQDQSGRTFFDDSQTLLLTENGWLDGRREGNSDMYFLCYHHDYFAALRDFYQLCGAPPMLPRYAYGNWWSRYWKYTEDSYSELLEKFKSKGFPFTVAMLDMDWHVTEVEDKYGKGWTGYTWNRDFFPDPERFIKYLHDNGLHTGLNLHPADGVPACEEYYEAMAAAMEVDTDNEDPVNFDFADPKYIKAYFKHLMHPIEAMGADFWWIDWQQGTESMMPGLDPLWALNHFHFLDNCRRDRRGMILSRYAGLGSHRYPLGFSGDTVATWNSLEFQPYFTANSANVGYNCWSHDIGGFKTGMRDKELFIRWLQFGVFSPIMRLHSSADHFTSKEPWVYGKQTEEIARDYCNLRHRLIPYIYTGNHIAHQQMRPMIVPLYYHYPDVKDAYNYGNQYFFGSELMVCPITEHTDTATDMAGVTVWLPEGTWYDIFTGRSYRGGRTLILNRKLENMAVFAKEGGILPLSRQEMGDNSVANPEQMDVYLFPGKQGSYRLYEDEGDGYGYREGRFAYTDFTLRGEGDYTLQIRTAGDTRVLPAERSYRLCLRGVRNGKAVGEHILSQQYDAETLTLYVQLAPMALEQQLQVRFEGVQVADGEDYGQRVFDFLMGATLPTQMKRDIHKVYKEALRKEDIALMLRTLELPEAVLNVLYELTFA